MQQRLVLDDSRSPTGFGTSRNRVPLARLKVSESMKE